MAEMVRDGVDGLRTPPGDAKALAAAIRRFVEEPGLLDRLRPNPESVRDVREDAAKLEEAMLRVLDDKAKGRRPR
jgi:glycosyltransferase involved in cell wall biosynthesis